MKKYVLIKLSSPGFEKKFDSPKEMKDELIKWLCPSCLTTREQAVEQDLYTKEQTRSIEEEKQFLLVEPDGFSDEERVYQFDLCYSTPEDFYVDFPPESLFKSELEEDIKMCVDWLLSTHCGAELFNDFEEE